jgi:PAS domain-containing protein
MVCCWIAIGAASGAAPGIHEAALSTVVPSPRSGWVAASTTLVALGVLVVLASRRARRLEAHNASLRAQIAERKHLEAELAQAHDQLERRVAERTAALEREVAEREQAEARLLATQRKLITVLHTNPAMISLSLLEDGTFIGVNAAFERELGYHPQDLVGRT